MSKYATFFIFWSAYLFISSYLPLSTGLCQHQGLYFQSGSSWQASACKRCHCNGYITQCEVQECQATQCAITEVLSMNPDECCPVCQPPRRNCYIGDTVYKHDEVWTPGSPSPGSPNSLCEECRCIDGSVSCGAPSCAHSPTYCPPGQKLITPLGQCCPSCISESSETCSVAPTVSVPDGTVWQPVSCTKCQCVGGVTQCYLAECPRLACPANHTLELNPTLDSACCPECLGNPCLHQNRVYKSGQSFKPDSCTQCVCQAGRVECHQTHCPRLTCQPDEEPVRTDGECCQKCRAKEGWCSLSDGTRKPHASLWISDNCPEVCECVQGKVSCSPVQCPSLVCGHGQVLVDEAEGRCCPDCQRDTGLCIYNGELKQSGEVWGVGCRLCSCEEGAITCYTPECPACQSGYTPLTPTGGRDNSTCCPPCVPVTCSPHCVACDPPPYLVDAFPLSVLPMNRLRSLSAPTQSHGGGSPCTACEAGYLLQEGFCVEVCGGGFFQREERCVSCHPSCEDCNEQTMYHCTSCPPGTFLSAGECVSSCPVGFFASLVNECEQCATECATCHGANDYQCDACSPLKGARRLLLGLQCVETCPQGYSQSAGKCVPCPDSCEACSPQGTCVSCQSDHFVQKGLCVDRCQLGYYLHDNKCSECHPLCQSCNGGSISSCLTCPPHLHLYKGSCHASCPPGSYLTEMGGNCAPCYRGCKECSGGSEQSCTSCSSTDFLVVEEEEWMGKCVESCPKNFEVDGAFCRGIRHCLQKAGAYCTHCSPDYLLQEGKCVAECDDIFYKDGNNCYSCDARCSSCSGPSPTHCLSCPPLFTFYRRNPEEASCLTKCRDGYYLTGDLTCRACAASCSACILNPDSESQESLCLECKESGLTPEGPLCTPTCSPGYFNSSREVCAPCHDSCSQCSHGSSSGCTECSQGKVLTKQGTCSSTQCIPGTRLHPSGCIPCPPHCSSCDDNGCTQCYSGRYILHGQCVQTCPIGTHFPSPGLEKQGGECLTCHHSCRGCIGPLPHECLQCEEGFVREKGACVQSCSARHYLSPTHQCEPCSTPGCLSCSNGGRCSSCEPPYVLYKDQCLSQCPLGTHTNLWEHQCQDCSSNCSMCSMSACLGCFHGFFLQNGVCVEECSSNHHSVERNVSMCVSNVYQPILSVLSPLVVEYGMPKALDSSVIHIFDKDTDEEGLNITLVEPPSNGMLYEVRNGSNALLRMSQNFTAKDLREGRILYRHNKESSFYGEMKVQLSDGEFTTNPTTVSINIMSTHPPQIVVNEPLVVPRGGKRTITTNTLQIIDRDSPAAVNIVIRDGPFNGRLTIHNEDLALFNLSELSANLVTYIHYNEGDDSTTYIEDSDMMLLQATDGHNVVNFRLKVLIVDDRMPLPILINNKVLSIPMGQRQQISPYTLKARALDARNEDLVYSMTRGEFLLLQVTPQFSPAYPSTPVPNDGVNTDHQKDLFKRVSSFSQKDLNEGRVWFVSHQATLLRDEPILFSLKDNTKPQSVLRDQSFVIRVSDDSVSTKVSLRPQPRELSFEVYEGQALTFTPDDLNYPASPSSSKHDIVYSITHPLGPEDGVLFHIDSPGLELVEFTQFDIDNGKVIYLPPFVSIGPEKKTVSFKFTVSDGQGFELSEQKLSVTIMPLVTEETLNFIERDPVIDVPPGGSVQLPHSVFSLTLEGNMVIYMVDESPLYGTLTITPTLGEQRGVSVPFTREITMTPQDISSSIISYSHSPHSTDITSDSVRLVAMGQSSDASSLITFNILTTDTISPLKVKGASFNITVKEGSSTLLSPSILYFSDLHTPESDLIYTLTSAPSRGSLIHIKGQALVKLNATNKFPQSAVTEGKLMYSTDEEVGPVAVEDEVLFDVTDSSDNALRNQALHISISPVDNKGPVLLSSSPDSSVTVPEGGAAQLPSGLLTVSDIDTPPDRLRVFLLVPPVHGFISTDPQASFPEGSLNHFPLALLQEGEVFYIQSQSEEQEPRTDAMLLSITDGVSTTPSFRVNITITPVDDERPFLLTHSLDVPRGAVMTIDNNSLVAADNDTPLTNLMVVVTKLPEHGSLYLKESPLQTVKDSSLVTEGQSITMLQIISGNLVYEHDGSDHNQDMVELKVSDGEQESGAALQMNILAASPSTANELHPPTLPHITRWEELSVPEGGWGYLSSDVISSEVPSLPDAEVEYVLAKEPSSGVVEVLDVISGVWSKLRSGQAFPQSKVVGKFVRYYTNPNIEPTPTSDEMSLDLYIASNNYDFYDVPMGSLLNQILKINILSNDTTTIPKLLLNPIKVTPNTHVQITSSHINLSPTTTNLKMVVVTPPTYGNVNYRDESTGHYRITKEFSPSDLDKGLISIFIEKSVETDHFDISVTGGYLDEHGKLMKTPATVQVEVMSGAALPVIISNTGIDYLEATLTDEATRVITPAMLRSSSGATRPSDILYTVGSDSSAGGIFVEDKKRDSFTQEEINKGLLSYKLENPSPFFGDFFTFNVHDKSLDTTLENINFTVQWSILSFANKSQSYLPIYESVEIPITRRGNILTAASVQCSYFDGVQKLTRNVVFESGTTESSCTVTTNNNMSEPYLVTLGSAEKSLIGEPKVIELGRRKLSEFYFEYSRLLVPENVGRISLKVFRSGLIDLAANVSCGVSSGSATKGVSKSEDSNYDFITVFNDKDYHLLTFESGQTEKICHVDIINDKLFELNENFEIFLREPSTGSLIQEPSTCLITIIGPNDMSILSLKQSEIQVNTQEDGISLDVLRSGDLNHSVSVQCLVLKNDEEGRALHATDLVIGTNESEGTCRFSIEDLNMPDSGEYRVTLIKPINATINSTSSVTKVLLSKPETTTIEFQRNMLSVNEVQGFIDVPVIRIGNLLSEVSVNCFTRSRSAKPGEDYVNRPKLKNSTIVFGRNIEESSCRINLIDDSVYEEEEFFLVKLAHPQAADDIRVVLGNHKLVRVRIKNEEDRPKIYLDKRRYSLRSPETERNVSRLTVKLERRGDLSLVSRLRVTTRDDTAIGGVDYVNFDDVITFRPGQSRATFIIQVKFISNWTKDFLKFLVNLTPMDEFTDVMSQEDTEDTNQNSSLLTIRVLKPRQENSLYVSLPGAPLAVSLDHYDTVLQHLSKSIRPGYPLVCVSPCESRHPDYRSYKEKCHFIGLKEGENRSRVDYSWQRAVPQESGQISSPFEPILLSTSFAKSNEKILDSVFFESDYLVKCVATVVDANGQSGTPVHSDVVRISSYEQGICVQDDQNLTITATLSYSNDMSLHNDSVSIAMTIPHYDGSIPIISTMPLHNINYLLTEDLDSHACSNLHLLSGLLSTSPSTDEGTSMAHQWDATLRGEDTLSLYRHLSLKRCEWQYLAWFTMRHFVEQCGGMIEQNHSTGRVLISVPVYVTYVAATSDEWASGFEEVLSLHYEYVNETHDNSLKEEPTYSADIEVESIFVDKANKLTFEFTSSPSFNGKFTPLSAVSDPRGDPMTLTLLEDLGNSQRWKATNSKSHTIDQFTGVYQLSLVPCSYETSDMDGILQDSPVSYPLTSLAPSYGDSESQRTSICVPQSKSIALSVPISLPSSERPVSPTYTLGVDFHLSKGVEDEDLSSSFYPGEKIYGRLKYKKSDSASIRIHRVYLCSAEDGYTPSYDPTGELYGEGPQYGCCEDHPRLTQRVLVLDHLNPDPSKSRKDALNLSAQLLGERTAPEIDSSGESFVLDTSALQAMESDRWYIQVQYSIASDSENIFKRSALGTKGSKDDYISSLDYFTNENQSSHDYQHIQSDTTLPTKNGTNIKAFVLESRQEANSTKKVGGFSVSSALYISLAVVLFLLVLVVVVFLALRYYRLRQKEHASGGGIMVVEREEIYRRDSSVGAKPDCHLQTIKVRTLALNMRDNMSDGEEEEIEEGTEV